MTPPPRDRWIVVWVGKMPFAVHWREKRPWFPEEAFYTGETAEELSICFYQHQIAAWAECPARPEEGE